MFSGPLLSDYGYRVAGCRESANSPCGHSTADLPTTEYEVSTENGILIYTSLSYGISQSFDKPDLNTEIVDCHHDFSGKCDRLSRLNNKLTWREMQQPFKVAIVGAGLGKIIPETLLSPSVDYRSQAASLRPYRVYMEAVK